MLQPPSKPSPILALLPKLLQLVTIHLTTAPPNLGPPAALLRLLSGHAQDFRGRFGDAAIGCKTLPLLLPPCIACWLLALPMTT
ncbi:hypothetical protein B0H14DRAFT_3906683 [Mycena olivaceomarginata]|nr:hypothetical protein B0H14DRAFT_3906683 [Mycena olivaceomarginata]